MQWRSAMSNRIQVRWVEHAESRSVLEHAALQRAASEPHVSIGHVRTGSTWFNWLRELGRPLRRTLATARSPLADTTIAVQARSLATLQVAYTDVDDDRIPAA